MKRGAVVALAALTLSAVSCGTPYRPGAVAGLLAAGTAVQAFEQSEGRWPQSERELRSGAATAGVTLRRGRVTLTPDAGGKLKVEFREAGYAGNSLLGIKQEDVGVIYLEPGARDMLITER